MTKLRFQRCRVEHTVFYQYDRDQAIIVTADVDDMIIMGNLEMVVWEFKEGLAKEVKIKDLGELWWMLGIQVKWDQKVRTIAFSQCAYTAKILEQFGLQDPHPLSTPLNPHHKLSLAQCPDMLRQYAAMKNVPYLEAIGLLMYTTLGTQPDIMFAVTFLSQFMQTPRWPHWEEVKQVFRYLKGMIDLLLVIDTGGNWTWVSRIDLGGIQGWSIFKRGSET